MHVAEYSKGYHYDVIILLNMCYNHVPYTSELKVSLSVTPHGAIFFISDACVEFLPIFYT